MGLKLSPFSIAILLSYEIKLFTSIALDPRNEGIRYRDPGRITLKASSATEKAENENPPGKLIGLRQLSGHLIFNKTCCKEKGVPDYCMGLCILDKSNKKYKPIKSVAPPNACDKWESTAKECVIEGNGEAPEAPEQNLDDNDDPKECESVDCTKVGVLKYCPKTCSPINNPAQESEICKFEDCSKPNSARNCPVSCPASTKDPGQLSPYDFAIDCCKSNGVPRVCHGLCVPGGAVEKARKKQFGIKCAKHVNKMNTCKKDASGMLSTVNRGFGSERGQRSLISNSVPLAPIQNSSDIATKESSLSSTTFPGPGKVRYLLVELNEEEMPPEQTNSESLGFASRSTIQRPKDAADAADQPGQELDTYEEFDLDVIQRVANQGHGNNSNRRRRGRG